MTLSTEQKVLSITDAKIASVSVNDSTTYTKGTYIDLPQLKTLDVTVKSETKEAKAGLTILDTFTIKQGYEVKFESIDIPLSVIELINGATLTATGTTSTQTQTLIETSSDVPTMFNLAFRTEYIDSAWADLHMELYCVKGLLDVVSKSDDYWTCSFTGTAYARKKDGAFRAITANETATEIS